MILINLLPHREERRAAPRRSPSSPAWAPRRSSAWPSSAAGTSVAAAAHLEPAAAQPVPAAPRSSKLEVADQGHRHAAGRDRGAEGAAEGGRRPADRPQRAGAPAQRAGEADARRHLHHVGQAGRPDARTLSGIAQTNERVSEFLRNTAYNSEWLVAARAGRDQGGVGADRHREQKRLFDFSVRLTRQASAGQACRRSRRAARFGASSRASAAPAEARPERAMATNAKSVNVDLNSVFEGAASQFRGLNPNEPGQWPMLPKAG